MRRTAPLALLITALLAVGSIGCYHRVVSSRGLGGMGSHVQESYRSDTAADRAVDGMFGPTEKPMRGGDNMPLQGKSKWTADTTGGGIKGPLPKPVIGQGGSSGH